jgi:hypothetical protein
VSLINEFNAKHAKDYHPITKFVEKLNQFDKFFLMDFPYIEVFHQQTLAFE